MKKTYDEMEAAIIAYLDEIPDPRCRRGVRYRYADLLLMAVYSALAGHSEATEMEYYVELNREYFSELIGLETVPSHDTFSRVMQMTDVEALGRNIASWIGDNFPQACEKIDGCRVLHVDGKAVRAAARKAEGEKPVYNMNAMYEGEGISLYLKKVGEKENEISVLPAYLEMFNLKDTIVTIDAMGCNQTVIGHILDRKGHYMMPVKENQPKLRDVILREVEALERSGQFEKLNSTERMLKEHGRIESMKIHMISDTTFIFEELGMKSFYGSIARIGIIDKRTTRMEGGDEKTSSQRSIVITDLENVSVENLLRLKLSHWNIEAQHWVLDVQLDEDRKTARKGNATVSGAVLRRFCLMMRKYSPEFEKKPLNRFLMANEHDIKRIEKILFVDSRKSTGSE